MSHHILIKNAWSAKPPKTMTVSSYIEDVHYDFEGATETAQYTADESLRRLGRLVKELTSSGVLSYQQLSRIKNGHDGDIISEVVVPQ